MGLLKRLFEICVILAVILFTPGLPPWGRFQVIDVAPTQNFKDALNPKNYALNMMDRLFEGQIVGPECIQVSPTDPNVMYVSLSDSIVKIINGTQMLPVATLTRETCQEWEAKKCGRPLGIRFDKHGHMIVADAYLGIFKINVETGESVNLVSNTEVVDGKAAKIINMAIPASCGKIYYTVSSTNFYFNEGVAEMLGSPSGRLMVFDPHTNTSKVLLEDVHFANGILLSSEEDYLIFAETLQYRILRYWLKGNKAGTMDVFAEGLPGSPDNLNTSPSGNILAALVTVHKPGDFNPPVFMFGHPWLRKLILRLILITVKLPLDLISYYLENPITQTISFNLLNFETLKPLLLPYGMILELDWKGRIINSWHTESNEGVRPFFSDAKIINGYMYLGSVFNDYLGRMKLDA